MQRIEFMLEHQSSIRPIALRSLACCRPPSQTTTLVLGSTPKSSSQRRVTDEEENKLKERTKEGPDWNKASDGYFFGLFFRQWASSIA